MYTGSKCAFTDGNGRAEWFQVKSGINQGCKMSGLSILHGHQLDNDGHN